MDAEETRVLTLIARHPGISGAALAATLGMSDHQVLSVVRRLQDADAVRRIRAGVQTRAMGRIGSRWLPSPSTRARTDLLPHDVSIPLPRSIRLRRSALVTALADWVALAWSVGAGLPWIRAIASRCWAPWQPSIDAVFDGVLTMRIDPQRHATPSIPSSDDRPWIVIVLWTAPSFPLAYVIHRRHGIVDIIRTAPPPHANVAMVVLVETADPSAALACHVLAECLAAERSPIPCVVTTTGYAEIGADTMRPAWIVGTPRRPADSYPTLWDALLSVAVSSR